MSESNRTLSNAFEPNQRIVGKASVREGPLREFLDYCHILVDRAIRHAISRLAHSQELFDTRGIQLMEACGLCSGNDSLDLHLLLRRSFASLAGEEQFQMFIDPDPTMLVKPIDQAFTLSCSPFLQPPAHRF